MTQPYTAADVEVAELALCRTRFWLVAMERSVMSEDDLAESARAVLSALAAAGRLTPAGGEWKWGIRLKSDLGGTWILPRDDEAHARQFLDEQLADRESCELVRHWVGPWLPVPEEDTDAHTS